MLLTKDDKINYVNIGLMLVSMLAAFILPFETFLFAYAFLGPLHYLTEISWLHDRKYFSKGRYDYIVLLVISVIISYDFFAIKYEFSSSLVEKYEELNLYGKLLSMALIASIIFALVENIWIKLISMLLIYAFVDQWFAPNYINAGGEEVFKPSFATFTVTSLVPTLIHVYLFTGLFMLYGALKSRSYSGLIQVAFFVLIPFVLFNVFSETVFLEVSSYGKQAYDGDGQGFLGLNIEVLKEFNLMELPPLLDENGQQLYYVNGTKAINMEASKELVFYSQTGILLMRFIAFAYLYHYLNWFSKTEIIRWHKVPKIRFIAVIFLWITACSIYVYDYSLGLTFLFFLSFCHVLLEFPLNMISITGIGKEIVLISKNGFQTKLKQ
ncbi:MAG: hypothetical protein RL037_2154 [Bacteroidota bacterium]|jgi:hypothetical protein